MTTQPSRRRKVNNLTQSLGRLAHVKSKTLAWLKLYDKARSRDTPSSVSVHMYPSVLTLHPPPQVLPPVPLSSPLMPTPLSAWSAEVPPPLTLCCSFCAQPVSRPLISYNFMLPSPYVLTCASCLAKK